MRIRCNRCATSGEPDPFWVLRTSGCVVNVAELDDTVYPAQVSGDV